MVKNKDIFLPNDADPIDRLLFLEQRVIVREKQAKGIAEELTEMTRQVGILIDHYMGSETAKNSLADANIQYPPFHLKVKVATGIPDFPQELEEPFATYHTAFDLHKEVLIRSLYDHLCDYLDLMDRTIRDMTEIEEPEGTITRLARKLRKPDGITQEHFDQTIDYVLEQKSRETKGDTFTSPIARVSYDFIRWAEECLGEVDCDSKNILTAFVNANLEFEHPQLYKIAGHLPRATRGLS